jgi:hypothetical protein
MATAGVVLPVDTLYVSCLIVQKVNVRAKHGEESESIADRFSKTEDQQRV